MCVKVRIVSCSDIKAAIAGVLSHGPEMLTEERAFVIKLVLSELLTNCFEHAGGQVALTYSVSQGCLKACITDNGNGFDWRNCKSLPPVESESGRGIYLARALSDELRYNRRGNMV